MLRGTHKRGESVEDLLAQYQEVVDLERKGVELALGGEPPFHDDVGVVKTVEGEKENSIGLRDTTPAQNDVETLLRATQQAVGEEDTSMDILASRFAALKGEPRSSKWVHTKLCSEDAEEEKQWGKEEGAGSGDERPPKEGSPRSSSGHSTPKTRGWGSTQHTSLIDEEEVEGEVLHEGARAVDPGQRQVKSKRRGSPTAPAEFSPQEATRVLDEAHAALKGRPPPKAVERSTSNEALLPSLRATDDLDVIGNADVEQILADVDAELKLEAERPEVTMFPLVPEDQVSEGSQEQKKDQKKDQKKEQKKEQKKKKTEDQDEEEEDDDDEEEEEDDDDDEEEEEGNGKTTMRGGKSRSWRHFWRR